MTEFKGFIDKVENGSISGWVAASEASNIQIFCGDDNLGAIQDLFFRQDIVDAGISSENTGFRFDAINYLDAKAGLHSFSIRVGDEVIATRDFNVKSGENFILNPFFEMKGLFELKNANLDVGHRIGTSINRFISPDSLIHTNGRYTRISFGDVSNTRQPLKLDLNLAESIAKSSSEYPLELAIVARSCNVSNLHICLLSQNGSCIYDEPILIDQNWALNKLVLTEALSKKLREGQISLQLKYKHHGRRHIDLAMIVLAEEASKFKCPAQIETQDNQLEHSIYKDNLLNNGDLTKWSKGIDFSLFERGQELADNWFIELSASNQSNVQLAVAADDIRQDPLSKGLVSKFGLRARSNNLDGYARLICALNVDKLSELNYELSIDVEVKSLNKKAVIPKLYFIPRNAYEDFIIYEIARKVAVTGRQKLIFSLSSYQMQDLIMKTNQVPVLALAIDLPELSDIVVYSASLRVSGVVDKKQQEQPIRNLEGLFFEDDSITEQLHLLKGFDSWVSGKPVVHASEKTNGNAPLLLSNRSEFELVVQDLVPHKMARPTRGFPLIDIIVPVYNACDDVLLCLSSLVEKTDLVHRVIVVNDGDEQRTTEMLSVFNSAFSHIEILDNPVNIGYTKSVNVGIQHSNAEWVVVLNSDTIVSDGWLGSLMNCALTSEKIGMVGPLSNAASWQSIPKIHDADGDWHLNPLPKGLSIDAFAEMIQSNSSREYPEVGVINGFCQLINMDMLDEIGLLDEVAFPVGYGEENDMCARAVKAGYKLLIADDTYVFHAKSKSFGHEQRKKLAKQGSAALKRKHPDVDWGEVTKLFRDNTALNQLRENISLELERFENGNAS